MLYVVLSILILTLLGVALLLAGAWELALVAGVVAGIFCFLLWEATRRSKPYRGPAHTKPKAQSSSGPRQEPTKRDPAPLPIPVPASTSQFENRASYSPIEAMAQPKEPEVRDSIPADVSSTQCPGTVDSDPASLITSLQPTTSSNPTQALTSRSAIPRPATRRAPPQVVTPEHYRRHAGVPGFLYIAHNDEHRDGLFKMGYTTLSPVSRVASLNKEHQEASDIGKFHLVHSVQAAASYDAEQALFDAIAAQRVARKREFFYSHQDKMIRAANAAAQLTYGDANPLNAIYAESSNWATASQGMAPGLPTVLIPRRQGTESGWVYVCRNPWHREDTFRVSYTKVDPTPRLQELNSGQRRHTSQIGFYTIVHCGLATQVAEAARRLQIMLAPYRIQGSRVFYRASLPVLQSIIDAVVSAGPSTPNQGDAKLVPIDRKSMIDTNEKHSPISVELVHGAAHRTWVAWTAACPACRARLRFKGAIGARGNVNCPHCNDLIFTVIGASCVRIENGRSIEQ